VLGKAPYIIFLSVSLGVCLGDFLSFGFALVFASKLMRVCHITITGFFWPDSVAAGIITPAPQCEEGRIDSPRGSYPIRSGSVLELSARYSFWGYKL